MAEEKNEVNKDIDLSTEKARVDYFASARPEEKENFVKNHPDVTDDGFDNILSSAIGNSLTPDFGFNSTKYDTPEKIDGVNRNIGSEIEKITGTLDKGILGTPDLSITVSPFDVDNSEAGNKLRIASGQNLKGLNEYIGELAKKEIDRNDLPEGLKSNDLKDLLDAQNLTISNYLKELGFPRTEDYKGPNNPQPDLGKLFSNENTGSPTGTINETNVRNEQIKTETRSFTEINSIVPVQPKLFEPINNTPSPILNEIPRANIENIVVPSNTQNTSITNKETKLTSPTSVTNTNNSNSSTSINTTNPNIVNISRTNVSEYKQYDPLDEISWELGITPLVRNSEVEGIKSEIHPKNEATSSVTPSGTYDPIDDMERQLGIKEEKGLVLRNETNPINEVSPIVSDNKMMGLQKSNGTSISSQTPSIQSTGGLKITSEVPRVERSTPNSLREVQHVAPPQKQEIIEDVTTIGKQNQVHEEKHIFKTDQNQEISKSPEKTVPAQEPPNFERLEGIMLQILSVLKGPLLTIDSKVKYY